MSLAWKHMTEGGDNMPLPVEAICYLRGPWLLDYIESAGGLEALEKKVDEKTMQNIMERFMKEKRKCRKEADIKGYKHALINFTTYQRFKKDGPAATYLADMGLSHVFNHPLRFHSAREKFFWMQFNRSKAYLPLPALPDIKDIEQTDDPELVECRVEKIKGLMLRTEFLKKA